MAENQKLSLIDDGKRQGRIKYSQTLNQQNKGDFVDDYEDLASERTQKLEEIKSLKIQQQQSPGKLQEIQESMNKYDNGNMDSNDYNSEESKSQINSRQLIKQDTYKCDSNHQIQIDINDIGIGIKDDSMNQDEDEDKDKDYDCDKQKQNLSKSSRKINEETGLENQITRKNSKNEIELMTNGLNTNEDHNKLTQQKSSLNPTSNKHGILHERNNKENKGEKESKDDNMSQNCEYIKYNSLSNQKQKSISQRRQSSRVPVLDKIITEEEVQQTKSKVKQKVESYLKDKATQQSKALEKLKIKFDQDSFIVKYDKQNIKNPQDEYEIQFVQCINPISFQSQEFLNQVKELDQKQNLQQIEIQENKIKEMENNQIERKQLLQLDLFTKELKLQIEKMPSDFKLEKQQPQFTKCLYCSKQFDDSEKPNYCKYCKQQFYPQNIINYYYGFDENRKRSILNNFTSSFIYRTDSKENKKQDGFDQKIETGEKALQCIIENSLNVKAPNERKMQDLKMDIKKSKDSLYFKLLDEGNNCMLLSKYFNNVLVRFDMNYFLKFKTREEKPENKEKNIRNHFIYHFDPDKIEQESEYSLDEITSEILIYDDKKLNLVHMIQLPFRALEKFLRQFKDELAINTRHPSLVYQNINMYEYPVQENITHLHSIQFGFYMAEIQENMKEKLPFAIEQPIEPNFNQYQLRLSSNIFKSKKKQQFYQYYQNCHEIMYQFKEGKRCIYQICEYLVSWPEQNNQDQLKPNSYQITLVGIKLLIRNDYAELSYFFPNMDESSYQINGCFLKFLKKKAEIIRPIQFRTQNECVLSNYFKFYQDGKQKDNITALLIDVQLTNLMIEKLEKDEKFLVLQNALRTILSSVPVYNLKDINDLKNSRDLSQNTWKKSNPLQPQEMLGYHCIAEFIVNSQSMWRNLQNKVDECSRFNLIQKAFKFSKLMKESDPLYQILKKLSEKAKYIEQPQNIVNDLCLRNILQSCLDFKNPQSMTERANEILKLIFKQQDNHFQNQILMGLLIQIVNMENPLFEYGKFFNSNLISENLSCSFAKELPEIQYKYQVLPSQGILPQKLNLIDEEIQIYHNQYVLNTFQDDQAIDFIINFENQEEHDKKHYFVKHHLIDLRFVILKQKIEQEVDHYKIKQGKNQVNFDYQKGFSEFDFANLIQVINNCYSEGIDDQNEIRMCVDAQFINHKIYIQILFATFVLGFYIPFVLQLFAFTGQITCFFLNLMCIITQIGFLCIEILQFKQNKIQYFKEFWNYVDISLFLMYVCYFFYRVFNLDQSALNEDSIYGTRSMIVMNIVNVVLILNASFKVMHYISFWDEFGQMVQMVFEVVKKISYFIFFLIWWIIVFSWLFRLSGIDLDNEDYPGVNKPVMFFLTIIRNSIGDLIIPIYQKWLKNRHDNPSKMDDDSIFKAGFIWFIWSMNILFLLIILMNLFISIVSAAYEEVQGIKNIIRYKQRTGFIYEASMISQFIKSLKNDVKRAKCFTLSSQFDDLSHLSQYSGIVKTIKTFTKDENKKIREQINSLVKQQEQRFNSIERQLRQNDQEVRQLNEKMDNITNQLKIVINQSQDRNKEEQKGEEEKKQNDSFQFSD